jgi:hypothetical protein
MVCAIHPLLQETGPDEWTEHFCLVKPDVVLADEDHATAMAEELLAAANRAGADAGGSPPDFACHYGTRVIRVFLITES